MSYSKHISHQFSWLSSKDCAVHICISSYSVLVNLFILFSYFNYMHNMVMVLFLIWIIWYHRNVIALNSSITNSKSQFLMIFGSFGSWHCSLYFWIYVIYLSPRSPSINDSTSWVDQILEKIPCWHLARCF